MRLDIIYEDNEVVVCYKPSGIATQTKRLGQQDMISLLQNYRAHKGEEPYVGVIHRLDQPVEGLLVFAKTASAAAALSAQIQTRRMGKHYYAVGCRSGELSDAPASGTWCDYMVFDKKKNVSSIVTADAPQAKKAVLDYRLMGQKEERICYDITLHTGRHHQIRLQMAHHAVPIVGDTKYGRRDLTGAALALCSYRLQFEHPTTGQQMDFQIKPHNPVFLEFLLA